MTPHFDTGIPDRDVMILNIGIAGLAIAGSIVGTLAAMHIKDRTTTNP